MAYLNKAGSFSFSLMRAVGGNGDVFITKGLNQWSAKYFIRFIDDTAVILSIKGLPTPFEAVIKVLTNDSSILQQAGDGLEILQRMPDVGFADGIVNKL